MPRSARRLILMTRYPIPGAVKTRLIPALGRNGAARLHRRMTEHALGAARIIEAQQPLQIEVCYTDSDEEQVRAWLGPATALRVQATGDLGRRMWQAIAAAFDEGVAAVVMIGTDIPLLGPEHLHRAFELLETNDLVLGPAEDGGYYLIGLRSPFPELFCEIPWSTDQVLEATLRVANRLDLATAQLEPLFDVDRPEDLERVPPELLDGITWRR